MLEGDASDSDGSESASDSEQNDSPSSLVADTKQYELMQRVYVVLDGHRAEYATPTLVICRSGISSSSRKPNKRIASRLTLI